MNDSINDLIRLGIRSVFIAAGVIGAITIAGAEWQTDIGTYLGFPFTFYTGDFSGSSDFLWDGALKDAGCTLGLALLIGVALNIRSRTKRGQ